MAHTPDLPHFFEENINLEGLFDILSPKNNLVLADDMMLSDADGIILRVSENYERNFGFTHDSIVGKSAFDLEANGTFPALYHCGGHPAEEKDHRHPDHQPHPQKCHDGGNSAV